MSNKTRLLILFFALFLPLVIMGSSVVHGYTTSDDYSGSATAHVTAVEHREEWDSISDTRDDRYYFDAEYQVNGMTYTYRDDSGYQYKVGDTIDLRYDPSNPSRVRTAFEHKTMSNPSSIIIFMSAALLLVAVFTIPFFRNGRRASK